MPPFIFYSALLIYAGLYLAKRAGFYAPILSDYGADLLCLPIILHLSQWALRKMGVVPRQFVLTGAMVIVATAYVALVFEALLPARSDKHVSDPLDIVAYFLGAFAYYRLSHMKTSTLQLKKFWATRFLILAILLLGTGVKAQELDWKNLSAKEKAEMARQEQLEAAQDGAFLRLMDAGHALFEDRKYLQSIRAYETARELRPLNVYPPVIIRDIELSMKDTLEILREREKMADSDDRGQEAQKPPALPDREEEMEAFREKEAERQKQVDDWEENQRRAMARERALKEREEQEKRDILDQRGQEVSQTSMAEFQKDLAEQYSEGVTQRTYEEGKRKITERIVVKGSVGNEYKRVEHPWGGKFYFKNGSPISEDTWKNETAQ